MNIDKKYLIVLVGPTASDKTKLSIDIANLYDAEILSADSRQFYKELEVGTAKPNKVELSKAKHHFINNLSIHDNYSVGKYKIEVDSLLMNYYKKNNYERTSIILPVDGHHNLFSNKILVNLLVKKINELE